MIILCNPQIAELIEAASTFKSDIIISKNKTKPKKERETKTKNKEIGKQHYNKITTYYNKSQVNLIYFTYLAIFKRSVGAST